ncbi:hypothetical protein J27TS8_25790 [Robertmurraya siralis]|uniref:HTH marR-type domain-containing protein n=1 Tax=Robertmurraya siralis TaxID=77777 RepID=A0A920BUG7_9BACI|nr:MarR family transcriptional regulator [Robertmurraya siralis]GIN62586.1 hypothetical protein J27TS8_25790 [Robertmurraya siralis]
MNDKQLTFIRELNQIEYDCHVMLNQEYAALLDDSISEKQLITLNQLEKKGRMLTGELATLLNITPSAVSQMLNKLEKKQFIRRFINSDNRREIFVELAQGGIDYLNLNRQIELSIIKRFYAKLPWEDLQHLKRIMLQFKAIIIKEQSIDHLPDD